MGADQSERPEPIGWEELLTRLAGRRHARVEADAVTLWMTPRRRVQVVLAGIFLAGMATFIGLQAANDSEALFVFVFSGPGCYFFAAMLIASARPGPLVRVDAEGVHLRGRLLPWQDMRGWEVRDAGRGAVLWVRLEHHSPAVDSLNPVRRRLLLRRSRRAVLRGIRFAVADSDATVVLTEELSALADHPVRRAMTRADQERPRWPDRTALVADVPGVEVDGSTLRVVRGGVERLRVDDAGISGLLPDEWRSVPWSQLEGLGLFSDDKRPAILLMLVPGTSAEPPRDRLWRRLQREFEQPVLPLPVRGLPFDAYEFALLLGSHPSGEAFWSRNHPR